MGSMRGEGGAGGGSGGVPTLTASRVVVSNGSGALAASDVTSTELGYLDGVTSSVQTQIDGKQASNANLSALAGQTGAADKISYWTAAATLALATLTSFGRSVIAAADAAGLRTLLGLGTAATTDASAYQAADAELTALAGLTSAADKGIQFTGAGTAATYDLTAAGKALLDDADAAAQRTTLALGTTDTPTFSGLNINGANGRVICYPDAGAAADRVGFQSHGGAAGLRICNATGGLVTCLAATFYSTVSTGTAPLTVVSTTVVSNLNADKLDGKDATDFAPCTQATLTAAASVALDFAAAGLATLTTDQNTTFTTSNRAAGRQPYNLRIVGGGAHTLTFPAGWVWLNSTMPAAIASGKTGRLCLECYGTADTDVVASFAVEA